MLIHGCLRQPFFTSSLDDFPLKEPYGFLIFSGGIERVHWERMGLTVVARTGCLKQEAVGVFL